MKSYLYRLEYPMTEREGIDIKTSAGEHMKNKSNKCLNE